MIMSKAMRPFSAVSATMFNFFKSIFIIFRLDSESTQTQTQSTQIHR